MKLKQYVILMVCILLNSVSIAGEMFPDGCKAVAVDEASLYLKTAKPGLFMLHNIGDMDLWITHPVSQPDVSAGWSSRLQVDKWSALLVSDKAFELICIESKPGHEQQIPCEGALGVCQWKSVQFPKSSEIGTFWAAEDMKLKQLMAFLGRKGFGLPDVSQ